MQHRRLLGERTCIAREYHECDIEKPDCIDPMIFPGDRYVRETWLHFGVREDGSSYRYIFVTKRHDSPFCVHDSRPFEEDEEKVSGSFELQRAA